MNMHMIKMKGPYERLKENVGIVQRVLDEIVNGVDENWEGGFMPPLCTLVGIERRLQGERDRPTGAKQRLS